MKTVTFTATVAFLCCGVSSSFGQIQFPASTDHPDSAASETSPRDLRAEFNDDASIAPLSITSESDQGIIASPFDFFSADESSRESDDLAPAPPAPHAATDTDATPLPVGRHPRRTVVDTIVDQSTLAGVPHTAMAPVYWPQPVRAPNPIATVLLRQYCVDGRLWAGYPAQRAAECARMWENLAGCRHCGHGCAATSGCCDAGAPALRNRYRHYRAPSACDCIGRPSGVDSVAPITPTQAPETTDTPTAPPQPGLTTSQMTPVNNAPNPTTELRNVAYLRSTVVR